MIFCLTPRKSNLTSGYLLCFPKFVGFFELLFLSGFIILHSFCNVNRFFKKIQKIFCDLLLVFNIFLTFHGSAVFFILTG